MHYPTVKIDDRPALMRRLAAWSEKNVMSNGTYAGKDLRGFGFDYRPGEYIMVEDRESAMYAHRLAVMKRHAAGGAS